MAAQNEWFFGSFLLSIIQVKKVMLCAIKSMMYLLTLLGMENQFGFLFTCCGKIIVNMIPLDTIILNHNKLLIMQDITLCQFILISNIVFVSIPRYLPLVWVLPIVTSQDNNIFVMISVDNITYLG